MVKTKKFACGSCSKSFTKEQGLRMHVWRTHGGGKGNPATRAASPEKMTIAEKAAQILQSSPGKLFSTQELIQKIIAAGHKTNSAKSMGGQISTSLRKHPQTGVSNPSRGTYIYNGPAVRKRRSKKSVEVAPVQTELTELELVRNQKTRLGEAMMTLVQSFSQAILIISGE